MNDTVMQAGAGEQVQAGEMIRSSRQVTEPPKTQKNARQTRTPRGEHAKRPNAPGRFALWHACLQENMYSTSGPVGNNATVQLHILCHQQGAGALPVHAG